MSEEYMRRAIELAKEAAAAGEVPVGAVVVRKRTGLSLVRVGTGVRSAAAPQLMRSLKPLSRQAGFLAAGGFAAASCMLRWSLAPCAQGAS